MAIRIKFSYTSQEACKKEMEKMHYALVGTEGYKENDIAICEDGENEFYLVVGADNGKDIDLSIMSYTNPEDKLIETGQSIDKDVLNFLDAIGSVISSALINKTHKGLIRRAVMHNEVTGTKCTVYEVDKSIIERVLLDCVKTSQSKFLKELVSRNILVRYRVGKRHRIWVEKLINNERHKMYALRSVTLPVEINR